MRAGLTAFVLLVGSLTTTPAHATARCPVPLDEPVNGPAAITALGTDLSDAAANVGMSSAKLKQTLRDDRTL